MNRPDSDSFAATTPGRDDRIDPPGGWAVMPPSAPDPAAEGTAPMTGDVPPMHTSARSQAPQDYATQSQSPQDFVMSTPASLRRFDAWNYSEEAGIGDGADLVGYDVEAIDGHIGKIDEASTQVDDAYLVVDTGHWIFGKKVLLPAGTVHRVDALDQKVYVDQTKNQIKEAPPLSDAERRDRKHRNQVGSYYGDMYMSAPFGTPVRISSGDTGAPARPETEPGPDR